MKRIALVMLAILFLSFTAACTKMPEQVRNAKAFSEKSKVVQDNLQYEVKEYNFGKVVGEKVVEKGTYYNIRLEVSNIGSKDDSISGDKVFLEVQNGKIQPDKEMTKTANDGNFLDTTIKPGEKKTGWLVFRAQNMPQKAKLLVKESVIEIQ